MKWLTNFLNTSIGRKQLMALTGLMLGGFLVAHLTGNFLLFAGDGGVLFNAYAEWLSGQIWLIGARAGLLGALVIHMYLAFRLSLENAKARPVPYYHEDPSDASMASRSMLLTGVLVFGFVIVHLFNFTWADHGGEGGLYGLVTRSFQSIPLSCFYLGIMCVLCAHLLHGIQSVFQTFGLNHRKYMPHVKNLCMLVAIALCTGFASIPLWFMITEGGY